MARKAIVDQATGEVLNVILVEPGSGWEPPEGTDAVLDEDAVANTGDTWDGQAFVKPAEPVL